MLHDGGRDVVKQFEADFFISLNAGDLESFYDRSLPFWQIEDLFIDLPSKML